jgi:hypothetical protein
VNYNDFILASADSRVTGCALKIMAAAGKHGVELTKQTAILKSLVYSAQPSISALL